jgi:hypothetical protein
MKLFTALLITVTTLGCTSTQRETKVFVEELKVAEIYGFGSLGHDPFCTCIHTVDDELSALARETNALLKPQKQVHFVFVYDRAQTNTTEIAEGLFAGRPPCPVHSSSPPLEAATGQTFISAWDRLQMLTQITGLSIEVAPKSRTVILYPKSKPDTR